MYFSGPRYPYHAAVCCPRCGRPRKVSIRSVSHAEQVRRRQCRACRAELARERGDPEGPAVWGYRQPPLPAEPTRHPPGSEGRLRVYEERVRRGEAVFHPGDA